MIEYRALCNTHHYTFKSLDKAEDCVTRHKKRQKLYGYKHEGAWRVEQRTISDWKVVGQGELL